MHKYEMIVYWSEDDASFIVEVPELPGCMADGATAVDALINAEQAKRSFDVCLIHLTIS